MKRWFVVAAVAGLCLALAFSAACGGKGKPAVEEVKIGFGLPLSGIMGNICGLPAKIGIEFAAEKIGEFTVAGESYRWRLIIENNQWTGAGGVATATKLIFDDGVKIMHQAGSDAGAAAQAICEESGVLLDIAGGGIELLGPDKPRTFHTSPTYVVHTPTFFHWLTTAHPEVRTVAIAMSDDEMGHAVADAAIPAAEYFGYQVVSEDYYPPATVEFYPLATKLVSMNPDLVIGDVRTLKPMKEMGWDGLTAFIGWSKSFGNFAGWDNVQGFLLYQPNPMGEGLPQAVRDFAADFRDQYGAEFTMCSYYGATIMQVLTEAVKKAGTVDDVDKIIAVLETETFDTMVGELKYGGDGLVGVRHMLLWPATVAEIRDHSYHVIAEFTPEEAEALAVEVYE